VRMSALWMWITSPPPTRPCAAQHVLQSWHMSLVAPGASLAEHGPMGTAVGRTAGLHAMNNRYKVKCARKQQEQPPGSLLLSPAA
jgi:hypothetical protein